MRGPKIEPWLIADPIFNLCFQFEKQQRNNFKLMWNNSAEQFQANVEQFCETISS